MAAIRRLVILCNNLPGRLVGGVDLRPTIGMVWQGGRWLGAKWFGRHSYGSGVGTHVLISSVETFGMRWFLFSLSKSVARFIA